VLIDFCLHRIRGSKVNCQLSKTVGQKTTFDGIFAGHYNSAEMVPYSFAVVRRR